MKLKPVASQVNLFQTEEQTVKFWKDNQIFEKSIEQRPANKRWNFLDGPPFVTGTPHYGSLLSSIPKDLFGRYYTMKGYRVRRVWGWDGHGLPIENKVEQELGIKSKREIEEKVGIRQFIDKCLVYVNQTSADWQWYVDHIGRWVDFKNAYKTWDINYMETVMWIFKNIYQKGYIYKGFQVILFCPHCSTPISNFEVAMDPDNYKMVTELANTYKYKIKGQDKTFILAWSTTPWNKIVTLALAVNPNLDYIKVKQGDEIYILAQNALKLLTAEPKYQVSEKFKGEKLLGLEFEPHYDFYKIEPGKKAFIIIAGDFVNAEEGTGVVTIAAYGQEDLKAMQEENIQVVLHLDDEGRVLPDIPKFGGMYYLEANAAVNEDLRRRGLLYDEKPFTHSVPHCWRCGTRLYYSPKDAWYINIQELRPRMFANNKQVNWYPAYFKQGRFTKSIEAAPDWNISRNRYWGSPIPVWECECGEVFVPGSIQELEEQSGQKITNLHKPQIDEVTIRCSKCQKEVKRVPEVLDSWFEAGSASFAERHYPFETGEKLEDFFPPDFVAEYTGQIRAWFYVLLAITTALLDTKAYKNVLVEGVLLGTDGRKMSKNYRNFPDPKLVLEKYGGDALRAYLLSAPVMHGEDMSFSEKGVIENYRFLLIFWNSYKFLVDYASLHNWDCSRKLQPVAELKVLDRWVLARLTDLAGEMNKALDGYNAIKAVEVFKNFILDDFSTWYIRLSRERVGLSAEGTDRDNALAVMYGVLVVLSKLGAPLIPFISEEIYKNLTADLSVHLVDYPTGDKTLLNKKLVEDMALVRKLVELGHAQRKQAGVKLRQPLAQFSYSSPTKLSGDLETILAQELNVEAVKFVKAADRLSAVLDTEISAQLAEKGKVRELIRQIQQMRRQQQLTLADKAKVKSNYIPQDPNLLEIVLKQTNSIALQKGDSLQVEKV